jgi:hypothetical protein
LAGRGALGLKGRLPAAVTRRGPVSTGSARGRTPSVSRACAACGTEERRALRPVICALKVLA